MFLITGTDSTTRWAPVIRNHPQDAQIQQSYKVTLDMLTDETAPLNYQWYFEDDKIDGIYISYHVHCMPIINYFIGEDKSSYTIHPVTVSNAGRYYCQIKNQYGVMNSTVATVTVTTSSTIIHPSGMSLQVFLPSKVHIAIT